MKPCRLRKADGHLREKRQPILSQSSGSTALLASVAAGIPGTIRMLQETALCKNPKDQLQHIDDASVFLTAPPHWWRCRLSAITKK
jgi:hypothetical protein